MRRGCRGAALCWLLVPYLGAAAPSFADGDEPYEQIVAANQAFGEGRFEEALSVYEAAAEALGDSPELDYNQGAALYKLGRHGQAAELFSRAALSADPELSRRARFGWGNCEYSSALADLQPADPQAGQQPDLQGGTEKLESAIRHYRDALASQSDLPPDHPGDRAARENIERAQKLIEIIKELLEQQQQDQDQQQDQEQSQDQNEQQQDQEGEQQSEQQPESSEEEQDQQDQQQQQQGEQQEEDQQQSSAQDQQQPEPRESQQQQAQKMQEREMTPEEVEALLQAVRDKEKKRREEKLQLMRARRVPVLKDW